MLVSSSTMKLFTLIEHTIFWVGLYAWYSRGHLCETNMMTGAFTKQRKLNSSINIATRINGSQFDKQL